MVLLLSAACLVNTALYEERIVALTDHDGDGVAFESDCDDNDAAARPGLVEICDGIDNDCDSVVDQGAEDATLWYVDADGDGFGDDNDSGESSCDGGSGRVATAGDCDDTTAGVHPGASDEPYDGIDSDCDGADLTDVDGDGYDAESVGGDDCDDSDAGSSPGVAEAWDDDGTDNDCDGDAWDPVTWSSTEALTRIDGAAAGGEFGRSIGLWVDEQCLFGNAPYVDGARGAVYAISGQPGVLSAGSGGYAQGTGEGAYMSATTRVSSAGRVAVAQVGDRGGEGAVFVLDGRALCAGTTGAVDELSTLTIAGTEPGSWFGSDTAWLDDLDGDGLQELAVSAPGASGGGSGRGAVYLWDSPGTGVSVDDSTHDVVLWGTQDTSGLEAITTARDDDGSGRPWLILGQQVAEPGSAGMFLVDRLSATSGSVSDAAQAGLVTWSTGRLLGSVTVGDIDFDGSDDLIAGAWTFGLWDVADLRGFVDESGAEHFLTYDVEGEWLTGVAPAGDFDGDGRADLVLLAEDWPAYTEQGQLALMGGERFVGGSLDFTTSRLMAAGSSAGDSFGYRVLPAGDFDGDGADELLVAAPGASNAGVGSGSVYSVAIP